MLQTGEPGRRVTTSSLERERLFFCQFNELKKFKQIEVSINSE